jgi:hypothetical protein
MRSTHGLLLFVALTGACKDAPVTPPPRPPKVPAAAVWAGGPDGGAWILCKPRQEPRDFDCTVFHDSGDVWARGRYRAKPADAAGKGLHFNAFDGETLHLMNGGVLEPTSGR